MKDICHKHENCTISFDMGKDCPLCAVEKQVEELTEMLEDAENKLEIFTSCAPGII